jgi:hypothetical protein
MKDNDAEGITEEEFIAELHKMSEMYASEGNSSGLKELLEKGFDLSPSIDILLHKAIDGGHVEFLEYLVEQGADIAKLEINDIVNCAESGHLECVLWLAEKIETGGTAFYKAVYAFCAAENIDVVRKLIDDNKETDLCEIAHLVWVFNDVELVKKVCERSSSFHIEGFSIAAGMGNLDVLRYLMNEDLPVPIEAWEAAIVKSAKFGHVDTTLFIIDQGCNPDLAFANGTDEVKAAVKTKLLYDELTANLGRSEESTISIRKTKV